MTYSRTAVLLAAALGLTALPSPPAAQAASTAASAYSKSAAAAPKAHHARHRSAFVPPTAIALVPEVGDSSCHLEINQTHGLPIKGAYSLQTMCGLP
jgi:hypothetical protein